MPNFIEEAVTDEPVVRLLFQRASKAGLGTRALSRLSGVSCASLVMWKGGQSPQLKKLQAVAGAVGLEVCLKNKKANGVCSKAVDRRKTSR